MTVLAGRGGEAKSPSTVNGIKSWTLNYNVETLDATDFVDGQGTNSGRTFIPGLSGWSGSFEGFKDGAPQALGFSSAISISLLESQTATQKWTGSAYITGIA